MYAVEFNADIENGIVHIPQKYEELKKVKKAKFIVIYDSDNKIEKRSKKMNAISIDTNGFKFDREEANER
jgi:hypothetical protein